MTVHAITVKTDESHATGATNAITNWLDAHTTALPEQASDPSVTGGTDSLDDTPAHLRSVHRFESSNDRTALLDDIETRLSNLPVSWYQIESYDCDHDESGDQRTGCPGWTVNRSDGSPPGGI